MLPPFVVQKLKAKHDSVIVDHFDSVTVMFCEIVNFNALLEMMPAQEVVQLLNDMYLKEREEDSGKDFIYNFITFI